MVASSKAETKVATGLKILRADIGDLETLGHEWDSLDEAEQVAWSLDWDQVMGTYLPLLDEAYRAGRMTAKQAGAYHHALRNLKAAMPIIERLNLSRPSVSLDSI